MQSSEENSILWHDRYGHLNFQSLHVLNQRKMVTGLPKVKQFKSCECCICGKKSRQPFIFGMSWRAKEKMHLVHFDLCGLMQVNSLGGTRYFLLFIDDFTRMSWVNFIKNKYEVFDFFKKF